MRVKAISRSVGFDLVGIAPTSVPVAFQRWLDAMAAGYGGDMAWLTENPGLRADVRHVWPSARSVIVVGASYAWPPAVGGDPGYLAAPPAADEGFIARYARGRDYHLVVRKMLVELAHGLAADPLLGEAAGGPPSTAHRIFVDTGPVLEKAFAQAAGLGWIGKNTLLIRPGREGRGSYYFLGVVLTPLELAPDAPETDHCGSCRRCLDVCPTAAFPEPYVLDGRKCIAYWTIETATPEAVIVPAQLGQHVFGCDLCQEVCPWNRDVDPTPHVGLRPRPENVRPKLAELAALDTETFKTRFPKSAIRRVTPLHLRKVVRAITGGAP